MARTASIKQRIATVCLIIAMLFVAALYVAGCIRQQMGKYRETRDKRDHVKGQIQPLPHDITK